MSISLSDIVRITSSNKLVNHKSLALILTKINKSDNHSDNYKVYRTSIRNIMWRVKKRGNRLCGQEKSLKQGQKLF